MPSSAHVLFIILKQTCNFVEMTSCEKCSLAKVVDRGIWLLVSDVRLGSTHDGCDQFHNCIHRPELTGIVGSGQGRLASEDAIYRTVLVTDIKTKHFLCVFFCRHRSPALFVWRRTLYGFESHRYSVLFLQPSLWNLWGVGLRVFFVFPSFLFACFSVLTFHFSQSSQ